MASSGSCDLGHLGLICRKISAHTLATIVSFAGVGQAFVETVNQLLSYLSWRDTNTAIVIFNRNKNTSTVMAKIKEAMDGYPHKKRGPVIDRDTRFRYILGNPGDPNREIIMTVMVYDIPTEP